MNCGGHGFVFDSELRGSIMKSILLRTGCVIKIEELGAPKEITGTLMMEMEQEQLAPRTMKRVKKPAPPIVTTDDTRCMSRVTHDHSAQHFGNGRNKFYLEFRCTLPRFRDMDVCVRCLEKKPKGQQDSRTYDHGKINEPIPEHSHIFGGTWYHTHVVKWGEPEASTVAFALEHQWEARGIEITSKVDVSSSYKEEMPRPKKEVAVTDSLPAEKAKPGRKPKQVSSEEETKEAPPPKTKKRTAPRKKAEVTPYQSLASEQRLIYKEVTLPTHMEQTMEEVDLDDYEVEYVTLTPIEIGQTTYYIDRSSQKVFKRIRDKQMGDYVGRYDPVTESIHTDIPDSDDETDE